MQRSSRKTTGTRFPWPRGAPGRAPSLIHPRLAHARTRHQEPQEVTYTGASPRARAQLLGFSDIVGADPSTGAVPVLNHEAIAGGLARARDVLGDEAPVRYLKVACEGG